MNKRKRKYDILTEAELKEILYNATLYKALEAGGVDNWEHFVDSIQVALDDIGCQDIEEAVEKEILPTYKNKLIF